MIFKLKLFYKILTNLII